MRSLPLIVFALALSASGCKPAMQDFTSKEHGFKARFPGTPTEQQQAGPMGTTLKMFAVEAKDGMTGVAVTVMPFPANMPPTQIDSVLEGAQTGSINGGNGTLKSSSKITFDGKYPGREFTANISQPKTGTVRSKIVLVGNRLYQVLVLGTESYANSANSNEFLNSFQVIE